jgi:hypothetical protein
MIFSLLFLNSLSFIIAGPSFYKYSPIPSPRYGAVGGILYDKYNSPEVWVLGGSNPAIQGIESSVEVYSANWDEWRTETSLRTARTDHGAAPVNGTLYIGGGLVSGSPTDSVEVYSPSSKSWSVAPSLKIARSGHFFAADDLSGLLYVLGGLDSSSEYLSSVEVFNVKTNQWTSLPPMPTARTGLSAVVLESKLYAVGGCGGSLPASQCTPLSTVEVYDPATNEWSTISPLQKPRHSFSLGTYGSQLIIAGGSSSVGMTENGSDLLKSIDVMDITANEWFTVTFLPDPRNGLVKGYNMFVGISMFLVSGISSTNTYENTNELMALMCFADHGEVNSVYRPICK